MKIVFLDADTLGHDISLEPVSSLGDYVSYPATSPEDVPERISGAEVVITNKVYIGKKEIDSDPALRLICVAATGTNNVDIPYAESRGIAVRNAVDYSTESVAQITMAFILGMTCRIQYFDQYVKSGEYSSSGCFTNALNPFFELRGKTAGIVGLGHIGSRVAELASAFGMEILYFPTSGKAHSDKYEAVTDLHNFLSRCDVVSIHCPLNERTNGLIAYDDLRAMKRSAYLVNMGRGGIVVEEDLARALDEGILSGAALDVYTQEPLPSGHPFLSMVHPERIMLTPHIGWASREARIKLVQKIANNIITPL